MDWLDVKEFFKDSFRYIILIIIVLVIALYILSLQQVVGPSMQPTLNNSDIVILDRVTSKYFNIKRNNIIAFYDENSKYLIKRVIGLPGETISIKDNKLYIDGVEVDEYYLNQDVLTNDFELSDLGYDVIPERMYFVLGDNRENSMDSRDEKVGLIEKKDILGNVRLRIWPINRLKLVR